MNTIVQFCYGAKLNLHNGSKFWRKKLIWFQNFYYIKKAAIVSNFCLIGKISHDFLTLTSIELARKTFIGIQVKISIERTAFHWTCQVGYFDVVKIFMQYAATLRIDVNLKDKSGFTAFHWACRNRHSDIVRIFMEYAATLSIDINPEDLTFQQKLWFFGSFRHLGKQNLRGPCCHYSM